MAIETVRDIVEKGLKEGKSLKQILEKRKFCNPPKTSLYYFGIFNEETNTIEGSEIEDDGDRRHFGPIEIKKVMDYINPKTVNFQKQQYLSKQTNSIPGVDF